MDIFSIINLNLLLLLSMQTLYLWLTLDIFEKLFNKEFSKTQKLIYFLINFVIFSIGKHTLGMNIGYFLMLFSLICCFMISNKTSTTQIWGYFGLKSIGFVVLQCSTTFAFHILFNDSAPILPMFWSILLGICALLEKIVYEKIKNISLSEFMKFSIDEFSNSIVIISGIDILVSFIVAGFLMDTISQNMLYIILLAIYYVFSVFYLVHICQKASLEKKITQLSLENKNLQITSDETRAFRHDFHNIIQALGGYIAINDFEGLKRYYYDVLSDCKKINNISKLTPEAINNPAIYNILANKFIDADHNNIEMNFNFMTDLNGLSIKNYELSRILGILLDNAIEASKECTEKNINISFKQDPYKQMLTIENTYNNKQVSIDDIFEKEFTTKPHNTGLGLWEVKKILNKHSNLNLYTTKNNDYFSQQLEIYSA